MNAYKTLSAKHQEEMNNFPIFYAFSSDQFEAGMKELNLTIDDAALITSIGCGGYVLDSDVKAFNDMVNRQTMEHHAAIADDKTGEGYIYDMFSYELSNHEYCITMDAEPTLSALGLSIETVNDSDALKKGLSVVVREQLANY